MRECSLSNPAKANIVKGFKSLGVNLVQTVGSQVQVKIVKNKLAPPFRTAQFELEFGKGMYRISEIIDLGLKHKFIAKAGAMYTVNERSFRGKEALKGFLNGNDVEHEEPVVKLREKLLVETEKESDKEAADGETSEEIISAETTDEEAASAVGA